MKFAFNLRQHIWVMHNNQPMQGIVYSAAGEIDMNVEGNIAFYYLVYLAPNLTGVSRTKCIEFAESRIYPTRNDLIAAL